MSIMRRPDEGGTAALEFALVAPLLLTLLFGTITTALAYDDHLSVANAVREGSRFGAAVDYAAPSADWANSVRSRVEQTYFTTTSTLDSSQICAKLVTSSGTTLSSSLGSDCGAEPAAPSGMAPGSCVVKVWVSKPKSIDLLVAPSLNFNIGAQSVAYYGRTVALCTAE